MERINLRIDSLAVPISSAVRSVSQTSQEKRYPDPLIFDLNKDGKFDALDIVQYSPAMKRIEPVLKASSGEVKSDAKADEVVKHYAEDSNPVSDDSEEKAHIEVTA